ncbi:hypothetical protein Pelo_11934 [Pelomyxa schiedti]|nr:hypothetical protein Pelo_11934 [Pelomyxa schiedti]
MDGHIGLGTLLRPRHCLVWLEALSPTWVVSDIECRRSWERPSKIRIQFNFIMEQLDVNASTFSISLNLDNSQGHIWFDDVFVYQLNDTEYELVSKLDKYNPPPIVGNSPKPTATDNYSVSKIDGVWWFLVPGRGHNFSTVLWPTGTYGGIDENENPYHYASIPPEQQADYTNERKYRAKVDLNFNSGVKSSVDSNTENSLTWLDFGSESPCDPPWLLADSSGNTLGGGCSHQFSDPFDEGWQNFTILAAQDIDSWTGVDCTECMGYWTDNEIECDNLWEYLWSPAASQAFVNWLQGIGDWTGFEAPPHGTYKTIAELNTAWSSSGWFIYSYGSFDEIRTGSVKPTIHHFNDTRVLDDLYAFERVIHKKYASTVVKRIRDRESEIGAKPKPIISNRLAYTGPSFYSDQLKRVYDVYNVFDVIGVNMYPLYNRERTAYSREYLQEAYEIFSEKPGKPIIIGEFGLAAVDAGLWRSHTVDYQKQRGEGYTNIVQTLFNLPWTVGANWYQWENGWFRSDGVTPDPRNCGLVNDSDCYYEPLTTCMNATNILVNSGSRSSSFNLDSIDWAACYVVVIDTTMDFQQSDSVAVAVTVTLPFQSPVVFSFTVTVTVAVAVLFTFGLPFPLSVPIQFPIPIPVTVAIALGFSAAVAVPITI